MAADDRQDDAAANVPCGAPHPTRSYGGRVYVCDLPLGHDGEHVAHTPAFDISWSADAPAASELLEQQDAVIALFTEYVDDILIRARAVNAPHKARVEAGPFALYVEQRLNELVARVAEASK